VKSSIKNLSKKALAMATEPLYPVYLPVRPEGFTPTLDVPAFDADEPGLRADPQLPEILDSKAALKNITPRVGTEIRNLQLSQLTQDGLDQVALLAAQRGVLVFVSTSHFLYGGY
jgi:sulfonate dioxygenase